MTGDGVVANLHGFKDHGARQRPRTGLPLEQLVGAGLHVPCAEVGAPIPGPIGGRRPVGALPGQA